MSAEPTAEQRAAAVATVEQTCQCPPSMFEPTEWEWVDAIARALAAAVTAEREKYTKLRWDVLTIANELAMIGDTSLHDPLPVRSAGAVATEAARRIREVSS